MIKIGGNALITKALNCSIIISDILIYFCITENLQDEICIECNICIAKGRLIVQPHIVFTFHSTWSVLVMEV